MWRRVKRKTQKFSISVITETFIGELFYSTIASIHADPLSKHVNVVVFSDNIHVGLSGYQLPLWWCSTLKLWWILRFIPAFHSVVSKGCFTNWLSVWVIHGQVYQGLWAPTTGKEIPYRGSWCTEGNAYSSRKGQILVINQKQSEAWIPPPPRGFSIQLEWTNTWCCRQ